MSTAPGPFRAAYASALETYLREPTEASLRVAYELAREAVSRRLSALDLAVNHQDALLSALSGVERPEEMEQVVRAAGDFFLEGLSTFEMVQRGFAEVRETARLGRRRTELSRQLSAFLADASLALGTQDSFDEMLQLVAELARELVEADCCMVTVAAGDRPRMAQGASYPADERRWATFVQWLDLPAIYGLVRESGGSVRATAEQLARVAPFGAAADKTALRGWLAVSLITLDGRELGAVQAFDKQGGSFSAEDEAALVHLAQTASAALERARLYPR